jgi:hypothetical protein
MPNKTEHRQSEPTTLLLPPATEIFSKHELAERHPNLLNPQRVEWALRHRHENGLADAVFEGRNGRLYVHEPGFLSWFLNLEGRNKPRALRRPSPPQAHV